VAGLVVGEPLEHGAGELQALADTVLEGRLKSRRVDRQEDGDIRYWGVDPAQSHILRHLIVFSETWFSRQTGRPPALAFVMVNLVDAEKSPNGSGGGWHRDSLRPQYKGFVYLTDVLRESQGAFAIIPASNSGVLKLASAAYRIASGGNRYSDGLVAAVQQLGFRRRAVLLGSGIPFFADTSLIHRGLPISEGQRVMATVYMFPNVPSAFSDLA